MDNQYCSIGFGAGGITDESRSRVCLSRGGNVLVWVGLQPEAAALVGELLMVAADTVR